MQRDILLLVAGAVIGLSSSMATLLFVYLLEGMRLRRQWAREDELFLRQSRTELQELLATAAGTEQRVGSKPPAPVERPEAE